MRQLFFCFAAGTLLIACNNDSEKMNASAPVDTANTQRAAMPYTASYSSDFEMGNPDYANSILQGSWKDWEDNRIDNMKSWVADTVVAFHSDNTMVQGIDSLMARWKRGRNEYASVKDTIQAVMPVYSKDKKENWVLVWAQEINTKKDGTIDTVYLMETWRINKDGKADLLLQYDRDERKK